MEKMVILSRIANLRKGVELACQRIADPNVSPSAKAAWKENRQMYLKSIKQLSAQLRKI